MPAAPAATPVKPSKPAIDGDHREKQGPLQHDRFSAKLMNDLDRTHRASPLRIRRAPFLLWESADTGFQAACESRNRAGCGYTAHKLLSVTNKPIDMTRASQAAPAQSSETLENGAAALHRPWRIDAWMRRYSWAVAMTVAIVITVGGLVILESGRMRIAAEYETALEAKARPRS